MKVWKATILAGILFLCPFRSSMGAELSVRLDANTRVELTTAHEIVLHVIPHDGDAWTRLALRICGDATRWKALAELNGRGPNLLKGVPIRIPYDLVRPDLKREVIRALFPADSRHDKGWVHEVVSRSGPEGESLWRIAEWFTGSGTDYAGIRDANPGITLSTRASQRILIPEKLLLEPFRHTEVESNETLVVNAAHQRQRSSAAVRAVARTDDTPLEYAGSASERHAVYRLQEGEAIYSSVAVRFTGRIHAEDVNEVIGEIVRFSGIDDVSRLPVGYPVRIPLDLLTPEFRPMDDPVRLEWEYLRHQRELVAQAVEANRLEGVHVIIDPGHGGRDVGATSGELYEAVYVYDIATRLKILLEKETGATVWMTSRSKRLGYDIPDRDVLSNTTDHVLLTTPNYNLDSPVVGVNLRWYLANAIHRRVSKTVEPEKVVFISLHADSLHPSLKGAMVYIPGERHVKDQKFGKTEQVYLARAEVREQPSVFHSAQEAFEAEAFSNRLAESLMSSFRREALEVHPFDPVREHVVREKREWVPAVLRYNKVPTRVLVEVCNLANPEDRTRLTTQHWRSQVARALTEGIVGHFQRAGSGGGLTTVTAAR